MSGFEALLVVEAVVRNFRITAADGKRYEFEKYRIVQDRLFQSDFDRFVALEAKVKLAKPEEDGE